MSLQPLLSLFIYKIKKAFEEYLDNKAESGTTLMNAIKRTEYPRYLANPGQKIHKTDKVERKQLNSIKRQVIKEFCIDFRGQLLHIAEKKDITKPQTFIYNAFNHIERIYAAGDHNGYKKYISVSRKKYMQYLEMMYNGFLSIAKFVLLTAKTQLERLFNLSLWRKCWTDFKRT